MKTSLKLTVTLAILAAFVTGLFASVPLARLAPLSSDDREVLVAKFYAWAEETDWWAEYYATNDMERAFRAGQKLGLYTAAYQLENYISPAPVATPPPVPPRARVFSSRTPQR